MEYKIILVTSQFHSGRLRITFFPLGAESTTSNSNTTYNTVLNISENTEVSFAGSWASDTSTKKVPDWTSYPFGTSPTYVDDIANGMFNIEVLNPLVAPAVGADIRLLVFQRAGPDFVLGVPRFLPSLTCYTQAGSSDVFGVEEEDPDQIQLVGEINMHLPRLIPIAFFGEAIISLRSVIKRYVNFRLGTALLTPTLGLTGLSWDIGAFPPLPSGNTVSAPWNSYDITGASANVPTNFVQMSPLALMRVAYCGWRGSIKWKFQTLTSTAITPISLSVTRSIPFSVGAPSNYVIDSSTDSKGAYSYVSNMVGAYPGSHVTAVSNQPVLEVETPYYGALKFNSTKSRYAVGPYNDGTSNMDLRVDTIVTNNDTTDPSTLGLQSYVAAGDDFNFVWYKGCSCLNDIVFTPP